MRRANCAQSPIPLMYTLLQGLPTSAITGGRILDSPFQSMLGNRQIHIYSCVIGNLLYVCMIAYQLMQFSLNICFAFESAFLVGPNHQQSKEVRLGSSPCVSSFRPVLVPPCFEAFDILLDLHVGHTRVACDCHVTQLTSFGCFLKNFTCHLVALQENLPQN